MHRTGILVWRTLRDFIQVSMRFPAAEVTEKKKGAIGVRGIRLKKDDALTNVYLFEEGTECKISYHEKEVTLNRLKLAKRDGTGTKYRG